MVFKNASLPGHGVMIGDIHLDMKIWSRFPSMYQDSLYGFMSAISIAAQHGMPIYLLGDIFDVSRPYAPVIAWFRTMMDWCEQHGVPVYIIQGNHDKHIHDVPLSIAIHRHPTYIGNGAVYNFGSHHKLQAFDYMNQYDIADLPERLDAETDIILLHQAVQEYFALMKIPLDCGFSLDSLPKRLKAIILGDIHDPVCMPVHGVIKACYTGSPHPRSVAELACKRRAVILSEEQLQLPELWSCDHLYVYEHPIPSRLIMRCDAHDLISAHDIVERFIQDMHQNVSGNEHTPRPAEVQSPIRCSLPPFLWIRAPERLHDQIVDACQRAFDAHGIAVMSPCKLLDSDQYAFDIAAWHAVHDHAVFKDINVKKPLANMAFVHYECMPEQIDAAQETHDRLDADLSVKDMAMRLAEEFIDKRSMPKAYKLLVELMACSGKEAMKQCLSNAKTSHMNHRI